MREFLLDPLESIEKVAILSPLAREAQAVASARRERLAITAQYPLISIVMAAWNSEETLAAAIESILGQTYANFELIIVDDASEDGTLTLAKTFAQDDSRIELAQLSHNKGAAHARNLGLSRASGDFLAFQDADDISHPERLERQLHGLLKSPSKMVCLCSCSRIDKSGRVLRINGREVSKGIITMMFRREVLTRQGFMMPLRISEDAEYHSRIKVLYGRAAELVIFKILYLQAFSPDSLLFSDGDTGRIGQDVTHKRSGKAEASLREIERLHQRIIDGLDSGFVAAEATEEFM